MNPGKPDRPQPVPLPRRMVSANGGDRSIRPVAPHHRKERCPPTPVNKPVRIEKRCTPAQTTQEWNDISAPLRHRSYPCAIYRHSFPCTAAATKILKKNGMHAGENLSCITPEKTGNLS